MLILSSLLATSLAADLSVLDGDLPGDASRIVSCSTTAELQSSDIQKPKNPDEVMAFMGHLRDKGGADPAAPMTVAFSPDKEPLMISGSFSNSLESTLGLSAKDDEPGDESDLPSPDGEEPSAPSPLADASGYEWTDNGSGTWSAAVGPGKPADWSTAKRTLEALEIGEGCWMAERAVPKSGPNPIPPMSMGMYMAADGGTVRIAMHSDKPPSPPGMAVGALLDDALSVLGGEPSDSPPVGRSSWTPDVRIRMNADPMMLGSVVQGVGREVTKMFSRLAAAVGGDEEPKEDTPEPFDFSDSPLVFGAGAEIAMTEPKLGAAAAPKMVAILPLVKPKKAKPVVKRGGKILAKRGVDVAKDGKLIGVFLNDIMGMKSKKPPKEENRLWVGAMGQYLVIGTSPDLVRDAQSGEGELWFEENDLLREPGFVVKGAGKKMPANTQIHFRVQEGLMMMELTGDDLLGALGTVKPPPLPIPGMKAPMP